MLDATLPFRAMARDNTWAYHRLLHSCPSLSQAAFAAPRIGLSVA